MKLHGVNFGPVWDASGVRGFFGEGYWYHHILKPFGLNFEDSTFVAKTTTLEPRLNPYGGLGNMPLSDDCLTPAEWKPQCIVVKPFKGVVLNSVGLSGPGARFLFETGRWQKMVKPVVLSFMSVAGKKEDRFTELTQYCYLLSRYLDDFKAPVALQINFSCPNVGLKESGVKDFVQEVKESLRAARTIIPIPLIPKFNVLLPGESAVEVATLGECDAICISNTIPWGQLPEVISWEKLFGSTKSPLAHLGGGGLSGKPLLSLVRAWIKMVRSKGVNKPINAGGGILSARDAISLLDIGADSVFIGSVAMLRGWRVRSIIQSVHEYV